MIGREDRIDLARGFAAAVGSADVAAGRQALLELGWLDALDADEISAVSTLFRVLGLTNSNVAALADVAATVLDRVKPGTDARGIGATFAFPAGAQGTPLVIFGAGGDDQPVIAPVNQGGQVRLVVVPRRSMLESSVVGGADRALGLTVIQLPAEGSEAFVEIESGADVWSEIERACRLALAHQLTAAAEAMRSTAKEYAEARSQFAVPIASFQAVRHLLAEIEVAVASADAACIAAATTGTETAAIVAKVLAGRAAATARRFGLQVLGGIGFTEEHRFSSFYRRSLVLESVLGRTVDLEEAVGAAIIAGQLPDLHVVGLESSPVLDIREALSNGRLVAGVS